MMSLGTKISKQRQFYLTFTSFHGYILLSKKNKEKETNKGNVYLSCIELVHCETPKKLQSKKK